MARGTGAPGAGRDLWHNRFPWTKNAPPAASSGVNRELEKRTMSGQSENGVPTKIVVGTDGSVTAERAVHKATALAKAVGAELIVVSAYSNRGPAGVPSAGISMDAGWAAAAQGARYPRRAPADGAPCPDSPPTPGRSHAWSARPSTTPKSAASARR